MDDLERVYYGSPNTPLDKEEDQTTNSKLLINGDRGHCGAPKKLSQVGDGSGRHSKARAEDLSQT